MKDALYLAERSLDHEHPEQSTWLQHFTLAEILEKTGEYERALNHLQLALDQNPSFHPAHLIHQRLRKVSVKYYDRGKGPFLPYPVIIFGMDNEK